MSRLTGYNPLRWNCDLRGCFNKLRRPKIEVFSECFPGRINFGDVDGLVEINGRFALLEWKSNASNLPRGQALMYERITQGLPVVVFIVEGDPETMEVFRYRWVINGLFSNWCESDLLKLKSDFAAWATWARNGKAA